MCLQLSRPRLNGTDGTDGTNESGIKPLRVWHGTVLSGQWLVVKLGQTQSNLRGVKNVPKLDKPVGEAGRGPVVGLVKPSQTGRVLEIMIRIRIKIRSSDPEIGPLSAQSGPVKPGQTRKGFIQA